MDRFHRLLRPRARIFPHAHEADCANAEPALTNKARMHSLRISSACRMYRARRSESRCEPFMAISVMVIGGCRQPRHDCCAAPWQDREGPARIPIVLSDRLDPFLRLKLNVLYQRAKQGRIRLPDAALSASAGWTGGHPAVFSYSIATCLPSPAESMSRC